MISASHQILFGWSNEDESDGLDTWHVQDTGKALQDFGGEIFGERGIDGRITLKRILKKWNGET